MEQPRDDFSGIEFDCPQCGATLDGYHERCPHCDCALDEEFCAKYRPASSTAAKVLAIILLVGGVMIPLALLLWSLLP